MKDAGGEGRETLEEREARMKDFLAGEKIPGEKIHGKRWRTLEELEAQKIAKPRHDRYGRLPARNLEKQVTYRSKSIDHVKTLTGGRNRKERRGS